METATAMATAAATARATAAVATAEPSAARGPSTVVQAARYPLF